MDTDKLYIGEAYLILKDDTKQAPKSLGYKVFYYVKEYDSFIELGTRHEYYIERKRMHTDLKYIKEDTLIPYSSFGKKSNNREEIFEEIKKKLKEIREDKYYKKPESWLEAYNLALRYFNKYGNLHISSSFKTKNGIDYNEEGFLLGKWVFNQVRLKNNKKQSKKTKEKILKLDEIGMIWNHSSNLEKWLEKYYLLENYTKQYGDSNVPLKFKTKNGIQYADDGVKLGLWVSNQRRLLKSDPNEQLSCCQKELLKELEFKSYSTTNDDRWMECYKLAKIYYKHYGNLSIPASFKTKNGIDYDEDGLFIGNWLFRQREAYRNKKGRKITPRKIILLESIGIDWYHEDIKSAWMQKYKLACNYYKQHGNLDIPNDFKTKDGYTYDEHGEALGSWLYYQKRCYNHLARGTINEKQISLLKRIGMVFEFKHSDKCWMQKYELLKSYLEHYKTLYIPVNFKTKDGINPHDDGLALRWWLENQKRLYHENKLGEEKKRLLTELNLNLDKVKTHDIWMEHYELALAYYNKYGNLKILDSFKTNNGTQYDDAGFPLGVWLKKQKQEYKGKHKTQITDEQIDLLERIGIVWFLKQYDVSFQKELITESNTKQKQIELLNRLKSLLIKYDKNSLPSKDEINKEYIKQLNNKRGKK